MPHQPEATPPLSPVGSDRSLISMRRILGVQLAEGAGGRQSHTTATGTCGAENILDSPGAGM